MGHLHCPYNVHLNEMVFLMIFYHFFLLHFIRKFICFLVVDLNLLVITLTNLNKQTKETPKK